MLLGGGVSEAQPFIAFSLSKRDEMTVSGGEVYLQAPSHLRGRITVMAVLSSSRGCCAFSVHHFSSGLVAGNTSPADGACSFLMSPAVLMAPRSSGVCEITGMA